MNVPENTDTMLDFVRINGGKKLSGWLPGLIAPCATHFFQQKHCFHKVSIIYLFTYFWAHVCPFSLAYYGTRESCIQALLSSFLLEKTLSWRADKLWNKLTLDYTTYRRTTCFRTFIKMSHNNSKHNLEKSPNDTFENSKFNFQLVGSNGYSWS